MSEFLQAPDQAPLECAPLLAALAPLPSMDRLLNRVVSLVYRLRGLECYDDYRLERVADARIIVTPTVFNPKLLRTGAFFAAQLDARLIRREDTVLDMGTGSGVCAVFAARHAHRVVGVDINPEAVRCAFINAQINQLEDRIEVRHGDLFAPVRGERFDLVLFNPPFVRAAPRNDRDCAWRAHDVAERFATELPRHLTPRGQALVLLSSFGDGAQFLTQLARAGFALSVWGQRRFLGERVAIFRVAQP